MTESDFTLGVSPQNGDALGAALLLDTCCRVMILSRSSEIFAINQAAVDFLGSSRERVIGTRLADHYPIEVRENLLRWLAEPFVTGNATVRAEYILRGRRWASIARRMPVIGAEDRLICVSQPRSDLIPLARINEMISVYRDREVALASLAVLSDREFEVASLIAASLTDGEIARELHRSVRTVHAHRRAIGQKLGMKRRTEVAEFLRSRGLGALPTVELDTESDLDAAA